MAEFRYVAPPAREARVVIPPLERIDRAAFVLSGAPPARVIFSGDPERDWIAGTNPLTGKLLTRDGRAYFFKLDRPDEDGTTERELANLVNLRQLYGGLIEPVFGGDGIIVSPWFAGTPAFEFLRVLTRGELGSAEACAVRERLLALERTRCRDLFAGHVASLNSASAASTLDQPIHRLYHGRIREQWERISAATMVLPEISIAGADLLRLRPIVNGVEYRALGGLLEDAARVLDPGQLDTSLKIFGMSDAHWGNVLMSRDWDYRAIDYEDAGIQHPALDCVKPIFDVLAHGLHFAPKHEDGAIRARVVRQGDCLIIDHDHRASPFLEQVLRIRLETWLLATLRAADERGLRTEGWESVLRLGLLCAALLVRSPLDKPPGYAAATLALAVELGTPAHSVSAADSVDGSRFSELLDEARRVGVSPATRAC